MSLIELDIPTARIFRPLLEPSRYKGAYGGRGSGKSHFFAEAAVERCIMQPGSRIVCLREIQKDLRDSAKLLISDKISRLQAPGFDVQRDEIKTPGDGLIIFKGMQDYTADSIKSLEGFDVAWVEEAHTLSQPSLNMLRPTLRKTASELWFSWNPRRKTDAVDKLLRGDHPPPGAQVVRANWSDNPWFPSVLETERQHDLSYSASYAHVWEGDYATVVDGAYYATADRCGETARPDSRRLRDPLQTIRVFCDLGGSSQTADAFAMWVCQFLGREIRVLDYYETVGQSAEVHFNWLT